MHKPPNLRQELAAARNRNMQLEESLSHLKEERDHLQIEADAKSAQLSKEVNRERAFALVLALLTAALGLGVATYMPVIWVRIPCCLISYGCAIWIVYSWSETFRGIGIVRVLGVAISIALLISFLSFGYFHTAWTTEMSLVAEGNLVPLSVKGDEIPGEGVVVLEIGPGGTKLVRTNASENDKDTLKFLTDNGVSIEPGEKGPVLSTVVKDWKGNLVAEITNNHWRVFQIIFPTRTMTRTA